MAKNERRGSFTIGFLMGAIVGGLIGLILSPKSVIRTRTEIWGHSQALRSRADEMAASVRERVEPTVVGGLRERINPVAGQVSSRLGRSQNAAQNNGISRSDMPLDEHAPDASSEK